MRKKGRHTRYLPFARVCRGPNRNVKVSVKVCIASVSFRSTIFSLHDAFRFVSNKDHWGQNLFRLLQTKWDAQNYVCFTRTTAQMLNKYMAYTFRSLQITVVLNCVNFVLLATRWRKSSGFIPFWLLLVDLLALIHTICLCINYSENQMNLQHTYINFDDVGFRITFSIRIVISKLAN